MKDKGCACIFTASCILYITRSGMSEVTAHKLPVGHLYILAGSGLLLTPYTVIRYINNRAYDDDPEKLI